MISVDKHWEFQKFSLTITRNYKFRDFKSSVILWLMTKCVNAYTRASICDRWSVSAFLFFFCNFSGEIFEKADQRHFRLLDSNQLRTQNFTSSRKNCSWADGKNLDGKWKFWGRDGPPWDGKKSGIEKWDHNLCWEYSWDLELQKSIMTRCWFKMPRGIEELRDQKKCSPHYQSEHKFLRKKV